MSCYITFKLPTSHLHKIQQLKCVYVLPHFFMKQTSLSLSSHSCSPTVFTLLFTVSDFCPMYLDYMIIDYSFYGVVFSIVESTFYFILHTFFSQSSALQNAAQQNVVHGVVKSQTRLSNFPFTFHFHALEEEMATHSSVLAWRIPGTGEPGGLPSMGSHRVRHD